MSEEGWREERVEGGEEGGRRDYKAEKAEQIIRCKKRM
jgi:hypothetical protein